MSSVACVKPSGTPGWPTPRSPPQRTTSPAHEADAIANRVEFTNSVCVVTADQFPFLSSDFPELFAATKRMIGYWFWELEHVPLHMRQSIALVDEIWAGSRFVTDAFAAVSPVPVRHVPIPVAEPQASDRARRDFAVLADVGERPVFLTVLDHLSVTERKNPVGVIEAFRRAFAADEGPVLVIKTMNGHQRWTHHQRVLAAADGRDDIRVWDETLERADQMALVAAVDCMVSLHRSEGLGSAPGRGDVAANADHRHAVFGQPRLHVRRQLAADRLTDSSTSSAGKVSTRRPRSGRHPTSIRLPEAMRRIVGDAALAARLAAAGRQTMERQPSLAETGKLISHLLSGGD